MENETNLPKLKKRVIKVRKRVKKSLSKVKSNLKVYKIAKKISSEQFSHPFPQSVQEDFLLEASGSPDLFLQMTPRNKTLEVLFQMPKIQSKDYLKSTNIVGPVDQYYKKANITPLKPNPTDKIYNNMTKNPGFITINDTIQEIQEKTQSENLNINTLYRKKTSNTKKTYLKEIKSLEAYEKQKQYWENLGNNIADRVKKAPNELTLNSARSYEKKVQEIDMIDKIQKMNEKREKMLWVNSLRKSSDSAKGPPVSLSPKMLSGFKNLPKNEKNLNSYSRKSIFSDRGIRSYANFKKNFELKNDQDFDFTSEASKFMNPDKVKLESNDGKSTGTKYGILKNKEYDAKQIIEDNHETKVFK